MIDPHGNHHGNDGRFTAKPYPVSIDLDDWEQQLYTQQASHDRNIAEPALDEGIDQGVLDCVDGKALNEEWKRQMVFEALQHEFSNSNWDREEAEAMGQVAEEKFGWTVDDIAPDLIHDLRLDDEDYQRELAEEYRSELAYELKYGD